MYVYMNYFQNNKQILRKRWEIIEEALLSKIPGPYELEVSINLCYINLVHVF